MLQNVSPVPGDAQRFAFRRVVFCGAVATACVLAGQANGTRSAVRSHSVSSDVANVFVAPPPDAGLATAGDDGDPANCRRFRTAVAAPPAGIGHGCSSLDRAYALAQPGDTVFLAWSGRWDNSDADAIKAAPGTQAPRSCSGPAATGGCIRFAAAPGQAPMISDLQLCADFVELDGLRFFARVGEDGFGNQITVSGLGIGAGDNSCEPGGAPPHDIYIRNTRIDGALSITGSTHDVYVQGGVVGQSVNVSNQLGGVGNNGNPSTGAPVNHVTVDGVTFAGMTWTDTTHHHPECLHMDFASDSVTVKNSRFQGCRAYAIRVEAEGDGSKHADSQTNHVFENDFFDGQPLNFDCHDPGCVLSGITVRFNTAASGVSLTSDCGLRADATCTVTKNRLYGNVVRGSCPSTGRAFGGGWSESYNVWTGKRDPDSICGGDSTSVYQANPRLAAPGPPAYDDHLAIWAQQAVGLVPADLASGTVRLDIDGDLRPQYHAADAGADEWETSLMVLGRSIGRVVIGRPAAAVTSAYGRPRRRETLRLGQKRLSVLTYVIHGGRLQIYVDGDRIVGVGTTSTYYASPVGFRVGGDATFVRRRPGVAWLDCRHAYRWSLRGDDLLVTLAGGRTGAKVTGLTMILRSYGLGNCGAR